MSWAKLSDDLWSDARFTAMSDGAQALWMRAQSYLAEKLTDGFLPADALRHLQTRKRYVDELCASGYWEELPATHELALKWRSAGGWLAVGWQETIRSRVAVEADRLKTKQRVSRHRNAVTPTVVTPAPILDPIPIPDLPLTSRSSHPPLAHNSQPRARDEREPHVIGYCWHSDTFNAGQGAPSMHAWREMYAEIGRKNPAERSAVARHAKASPHIASDRSKASPKHLLRFWDQLVQGPMDVVTPFKSTTGRKGPSPVASDEQYAAAAASPKEATW